MNNPCSRIIRNPQGGLHRTLSTQPRQWKVVETVREKFTCRDCEKISQAPAPLHVIARGWAGSSLLAMIMFEKFGQNRPLNRQAERYVLEGVPIVLSTMADAVGFVSAALDPLLRLVNGRELVDVQAFVAKRAVEGLDERIVGRFARSRKVDPFAVVISPEIDLNR